MSVIWNPPLDPQASAWRDKAADLTARAFAPAAAAIDREQRYPVEHLAPLRESGISGLFIPAEYGGAGASLTSLVAVVETVAQGCASTAAILAALSLGAFPVILGGTAEQKMVLLGGLARDGHAVNFALSERGAGSDAAALLTTAVPEGDGWRIRGEKCWLGNGGHSRHFIVFARTGEPGARNNISAFVVDRDASGVVVDHYEDKMGIRGTTTTNLKLDTWVGAESVVGTLGEGLKLALATLSIGRVVVAAQANGIALCSYAEARDFAVQRQTFGRSIIDHQGVGFKLADAATALSSSRMMTYEAARAYDAGQDIGTLGAMAKLLASETSHSVVDDAMQILAGRGYVKPSAVERCYRDQRITEIYEGTSEIQRVVLARAIKKSAGAAAQRGEFA
ncbi:MULTISPECIES: acyl-CoA dehydrogenase family protein [Achromobacter]|uniref:acyl-CoA dehydrogenase family protein n=1 Tax=Achromobacter TaxID=222 RepID=UPI000E664759|nr:MULTISPECIES: acyl-CoA dehydrogenase family protein [Achromobacter]MBD9418855.1 acyl-CoA dehydrogenase family protein [Achromobacter sp. ACM04]MDQ1760579.1 acyl-CoA dehydrogenase family protein [Achromobacter aegrifaciens]RIJ04881.1 acyl-CoA dehydrogenase [Achromobacter sp. K91]CAB3853383.1 Acyl-CoA dehydrogenase [Achromobacter aegrifaciens]CAB3922917.1 Acyl-CoA dehydrogenase [Achromobacter aegrifaciens]